jgi:hypothetical protein
VGRAIRGGDILGKRALSDKICPTEARCTVLFDLPSPVGAGLPANGPGLLANLQQAFTVAATTVFAGNPAPTGLFAMLAAQDQNTFSG